MNRWLKATIEAQSDILPISSINDSYLSRGIECLRKLMSQVGIDAEISVIASKAQNSSVVEVDGDYAIVLDAIQSIVLRTLVSRMHVTPGPLFVVDLLQLCCALDVYGTDRHYGLHLLEPELDETHPIWHVKEVERADTMTSLSAYKSVIATNDPDESVDLFLVLHEFHHFLGRVAPDEVHWAKEVAVESFDYAKRHILGHHRVDFREWVNSVIEVSDEGLKAIESDLQAREVSYNQRSEEIIEELASDAFAIGLLAQGMSPNTPERLFQSAHVLLLLLSAYDLHQAMTKRARHSVKERISSFKPAHIADLHLRKIASIHMMASLHYSHVFLGELGPASDSEEFGQYLAHYEEALYSYNTLLVNNYTIPVTKGMQLIFTEAESCLEVNCKSLSRDSLEPRKELERLIPKAKLSEIWGHEVS